VAMMIQLVFLRRKTLISGRIKAWSCPLANVGWFGTDGTFKVEYGVAHIISMNSPLQLTLYVNNVPRNDKLYMRVFESNITVQYEFYGEQHVDKRALYTWSASLCESRSSPGNYAKRHLIWDSLFALFCLL